ncbi:RES domain-containing protein [Jannaschia faecimaris]|uniref:RES domain-containing protein n=1 Tax=Jannaschia faecimaris TaxID=1244108 RepID=A0A1H3K4A8_9RHOB|nr:RES family NAD+ phosphorylase [Jannaschia faecimaris]SDY46689.1 RES domain-containing protein [Jannaschia faecimaris]
MSIDLSAYDVVFAPLGTTRLIPSRFPPVSAFDSVTSASDLEEVLDLEGWTNDRLVVPRLQRLDPSEWVYGRPNASVVMSAFLHGSPGGQRFCDASMGAWYAATELTTAVAEVANGIRKEISLSALTRKTETYRQYKADLCGGYVDIFGRHPEYHRPDDSTYPVPQTFGHHVRANGQSAGIAGIRYESVRSPGEESWVSFRPRSIRNVVQANHYDIEVREVGPVVVRRKAAPD